MKGYEEYGGIWAVYEIYAGIWGIDILTNRSAMYVYVYIYMFRRPTYRDPIYRGPIAKSPICSVSIYTLVYSTTNLANIHTTRVATLASSSMIEKIPSSKGLLHRLVCQFLASNYP